MPLSFIGGKSLNFVNVRKKETMNDILESGGLVKYAQSGQVPIKKKCVSINNL